MTPGHDACTRRWGDHLIGAVCPGALSICLALALPAAEARAQIVKGRLLDGSSRRPILLATVLLIDSTRTARDRTFTDERGFFVLEAPGPGSYFVSAERTGYRTKIDGVLELGAGGAISVDFYLVPRPVPLATVSVEALRARAEQNLRSAGFYDRREEGLAWFMGPKDIEKSAATEVAHLFRSAPGAKILELDASSSLVFRGGSITPVRAIDPLGFCTPRVLVDGVDVATHWNLPMGARPGAMLDEVVDVDDIAGIEVHNGPASLPLIHSGTSTACTTVLIWTIHGQPGR